MTSVLAALLIIFGANAQNWQGFKKVEGSKDIPNTEFAMSHVFKLRTFNSATEAKYEIIDTEKQKQITDTKTLDTDHRAVQIETCRRYGLRKCPVGSRNSSSTIVLDGGNKLHACRHSFHNWIAMASKLNSLSPTEIRSPMIIRNYRDEVVYNSAYSPAEASVGFFNSSERLNVHLADDLEKKRPQFYLYTIVTDYMNMNFSESITTTPTLTISTPILGPVYNYGYPTKSKIFGGVKKGDTPGEILVASSGKMTEYNSTRKQLIADTTVSGGMSGGAMVNADGAFMGLVCGGDKNLSQGIYPNETELTDFWKKLETLPLD